MLRVRKKVRLETERLTLRPPIHADFRQWAALRLESKEFLTPWEPTWAGDHLTRKSFTNRVYWAQRSITNGTALPLFLIRRSDEAVLGAITIDHIRRGPAQAGMMGYWIGEPFARQGFMREAINAVVHYAFTTLDMSTLRRDVCRKTYRLAVYWSPVATNMKALRKPICRSTDVGAIMCYTPTCVMIAGGRPTQVEISG